MTPGARPGPQTSAAPTAADVRRWRQYLADERAEAAVYRDLATHRSGEEREILLALAEAEGRHEAHWQTLLGDRAGRPRRPDVRTQVLGFLARRFGSVFVLALAQRAEARSPYDADDDATAAMAADERIHEEVVRGLAARGRNRLSGTFRAAVFGANDGLVSNLSLVLGVSASGVATSVVLLTGLAGLLAGALSMGAGEYVSVRSQRELLEASTPDPQAGTALPHLDLDGNELALVYRARGMGPEEAEAHAAEVLGRPVPDVADAPALAEVDEHEAIGTGLGAALSSFCFFASGAVIPVLPYLVGLTGLTAVVVASVLVGAALLATGAAVGLLSGAPPLRRGLRQLAIGYGAAAVTYLLGLLLGTGAV
ncbi:Predicted Fe2+/Mn2+ transporter, VIT1/CCC1 family [Friedmanniella luteola]|uniref:Predicted Fe2+/Mn2+ transporter, VIT1/CCC1 family n=1 Tax=Friedmanniella luteola TaxID=546871 RepID=A0A1H1ZFZ0_9ACTN|nr:VIT1/CCC1 family protein [Friedmanniella luteola]SDT32691.1 Predicted Fe2+/Mn2+ transporter, VIT1/CCC1 family [Friedmanniella luteola]